MNPEGQHDDRKDNVSTPTFVPVEHHALNHGLLANAGPPHSEQEPPEYPQAELPADEPNNPQAAPRFEIPEGARVLTVTVAAPAALAHFRLEQYRDWDYLAGPSAEECSLSDTPTELLVLYQQARPLEEDVRLRTLWLAQQTVIRAGTQADVQHQPYDPRLTGGPMRIRIPGYLNGPNPFHPLDTVYGRHFISVQACQSAGLVEGRDYIIEGIRVSPSPPSLLVFS